MIAFRHRYQASDGWGPASHHRGSAVVGRATPCPATPSNSLPLTVRRIHEMSTRSVAVILICGLTSLLRAQAPPASPKPGPEHKKLEYFLGKWTVESEI